MVKTSRILLTVLVLALVTSCSKKTDTEPSTDVTVSGQVTDVVSGAAVASAVVSIQGKTATTSNDGQYSITGLTSGATTVTAQHQGHVNYSQNVTLSGSAQTLSFPMTRSKFAAGIGGWVGPWTNATFGSSGSMTMTTAVDTIAQTIQFTLDLNGSVLGKGDPASEVFPGTYTETGGATITKTSAFYGTLSLTISATGLISGSLTNVPGGTITKVDFNGNVTSTILTLNYTVTFTAGGTATGGIGASRTS